jgi:hypothetical protein
MRLDEGPLWILLFWFSMYSAAVLATCLVRHILYAAVLAVGLVMAFVSTLALFESSQFAGLSRATPTEHFLLCLATAFLAIILAWQASIRDVALRTS